jgi:hypothetical protein
MGTTAMRRLSWVLVFLLLADTSRGWAQENAHVACNEISVALGLPNFEFQCSRTQVTSADIAKAREEMKGNDLPAGFFEAMMPPDATTEQVLYHSPGDSDDPGRQWGVIFLSISHPQHGLTPVALRDLITASHQDWLFGSKIALDWLPSAKHKGYETQRYTQLVVNKSVPVGGMRSCFAFVQVRNQSPDGKYGRRLWGYGCRNGETAIDDTEVAKFLSAIAVR